MRVAQIMETIDPHSGGTSSAFLEIVDALDAQPDCEVRAWTHAPDPASALEHAGARERYEMCGPAGQLRRGDLAVRVRRAIDDGAFDLVHLHGLWNGDLVRIAVAAVRHGIPTIWQPHGMLVERALAGKGLKKRLFMLAGLRRQLELASAMVYCTQGEHKMSAGAGRLAGGRYEIIPLPVRCPIAPGEIESLRAEARRRFELEPNAPCVVFMGRLHPVKRLELTLEAVALAQASMGGLRLLVFGSGDPDYERSLRERATALGLAESVRWCGWIGRDDRWAALAAGDVLTINSRFENFGYVIPEALMVGTAVSATEDLAMGEDLRSGGVGEVVRAEADALALAYQRLVPQSIEQRERGRRWADERFSPGRVGQELVSLYRTLLADRG